MHCKIIALFLWKRKRLKKIFSYLSQKDGKRRPFISCYMRICATIGFEKLFT